MSQTTITIRQLIDNGFDFGLDLYPIFEESHREELNNKILSHYRYYEIGFETPTMFRDRLIERLNLIMPYYNKLYKSESIEYNPLYNIDISETYTSENTTNGNSNSINNSSTESKDTNTGTSKNINSDVPQTLNSFNLATDINKGIYMTDGNVSEDNNSNDSTSNSKSENNINSNNNSNSSYTKKTVGSSAGLPFSTAIKKDRETYLNIDLMIIGELEDLFMGIW